MAVGMIKKSRNSIGPILLLSLTLLMTLPGYVTAQTLKVGGLSPFTGIHVQEGNDLANGVRTAIDAVMEAGGLAGFDRIELSARDTACDPEQAARTAESLIQEGMAVVIGAYCSECTVRASEVLDRAGIPMITPASTRDDVTERGLKYMFRTCPRNADQAAAAVLFLVRHLKVKTAYIVDDRIGESMTLAEEVALRCRAAGVKTLAHLHVEKGREDFTDVLKSVKSLNADVLYVYLSGSASMASFLVQAKRIGIRAAVMSHDAVHHPGLIRDAGDATDGLYLTHPPLDKTSAPYYAFLENYRANFGRPSVYSAYAYDSAMAYFNAIKEAGTTDPDKVRAAMLTLDFDGASKRIQFKENGDSVSNFIIQKIVSGEFKDYWNPAAGK